MSEDYNEAISAFEQAEAKGKKEGEYCGPKLAIVPFCMLGYTYLRTNQLEESKMSFDKYIEKYPQRILRTVYYPFNRIGYKANHYSLIT